MRTILLTVLDGIITYAEPYLDVKEETFRSDLVSALAFIYICIIPRNSLSEKAKKKSLFG